ncbi:hypothetical protein QUF74_06770 [Candidatus Halobeggiatoa sp. HSG11]|nr:hypothetical protein [Candidatus Halobeggiatoa sp. HSG11]
MIQNKLIKFSIALLVILTVTACYEAKMKQEGQQAVNAFLEEMSPELARKIGKIENEISLTEEKIDKLSELKLKHPNYTGKIETSRRQWEVLQEKLRQSLSEIRDVVENTYVTYELDRIQGGNQFNKISDELLSSADLVLDSAGVTKNAIEQALNEVEIQPSPSNDKPTDIPEINNDISINAPETNEIIIENPTITTTSPVVPCDLKTSLADTYLNLMMMVIATDKTELGILKAEINKTSTMFEQALVVIMEKEKNNQQLATLKNTWNMFKNTSETEIIPAINASNNNEALEVANTIQTERMNAMNEIIQVFVGDSCD